MYTTVKNLIQRGDLFAEFFIAAGLNACCKKP
jgi:hypothetical protein